MKWCNAAEVVLLASCLLGAIAVEAKAGEPVEATGWEGAKEALQQLHQGLPGPMPSEALPCYRRWEVPGEEVAYTYEVYHHIPGRAAPWKVDGAEGPSVAAALSALFDLDPASKLAGLDPETILECPPVGSTSQ